MPLFIIKYNAGYGDEYEEVEAESEEEATEYAYEQCMALAESNAVYTTVGFSTDRLREEFNL